jgi:hypothetical protein
LRREGAQFVHTVVAFVDRDFLASVPALKSEAFEKLLGTLAEIVRKAREGEGVDAVVLTALNDFIAVAFLQRDVGESLGLPTAPSFPRVEPDGLGSGLGCPRDNSADLYRRLT